MLNKITGTLRGWVGRYGSEAAFVGRVAMGALLPPGAGKLLEVGLEAAFEYLQGKSDVIGDHELAERLDRLGVPRGELEQALTQLDAGGQLALERAFVARQAGVSEGEALSSLRALVAHDPGLSALRSSMGAIADQLALLGAQGEVLIAGQQYQAAALEEMMRMIHAIASQVGASQVGASQVGASQVGAAPLALSAPSGADPLAALSALGAPHSATLGDANALSALGASPAAAARGADPLAALGATPRPSGALRDADPLAALGARGGDEEGGGEGDDGAGEGAQTHARAVGLVERFYAQRRARAGAASAGAARDGVGREEAVALVERMMRAPDPAAPHLGAGRVALTLLAPGPRPIEVVKWLCEEWGYPLQEAIIAAQGGARVVRRANNFVLLAQAQRDLEERGARLRLTAG